MWKYHSEDIFCQVFYQLKRVNFGISTWKHKLSDGTNECPWCWKVLRAGGVPELHQENCWDQPLPTVTWQILHRTLPFPILSFILTFTKVPRIIPFPVITPGCSAALLQDLLFFFFFLWLIDTRFEEQFRFVMYFLPAGEAGRTSLHLYASPFPKST